MKLQDIQEARYHRNWVSDFITSSEESGWAEKEFPASEFTSVVKQLTSMFGKPKVMKDDLENRRRGNHFPWYVWKIKTEVLSPNAAPLLLDVLVLINVYKTPDNGAISIDWG